MVLRIKAPTPGLLDDFLDLFDHRAFVDNPKWAVCYCAFFHHVGDETDWLKRSGPQNRDLAIELIREGAMKGFLAYDGERPVGWCNANVKSAYSLEKNRKEVLGSDDARTIAIVCFVIDHEYRRRGISGLLLKGVLDHYRGTGIRLIEAYPSREAAGDAANYHGPLSLYLNNGFSIEGEMESYYIVRATLSGCGHAESRSTVI